VIRSFSSAKARKLGSPKSKFETAHRSVKTRTLEKRLGLRRPHRLKPELQSYGQQKTRERVKPARVMSGESGKTLADGESSWNGGRAERAATIRQETSPDDEHESRQQARTRVRLREPQA